MMMPDAYRDPPHHDIVRIAPHSGIQFLTFGFDIEATGRFSRSFVEHYNQNLKNADGTAVIELRPNWNEDDPDREPAYPAQGTDVESSFSKNDALGPFIGHWVPVPYLRVSPRRDAMGRSELDRGPSNWARIRVSVADPADKSGFSHWIVLALDTELVEERPNRAYVAPTPKDAVSEQAFAFATLFRDLAWFWNNSDTTPSNAGQQAGSGQEWVNRWIDEVFMEFLTKRKGRVPHPDDRTPLEHAARYIAFLHFVDQTGSMPRIKLVDTISADPVIKPVDVDLVIDIGNSRTCGMLVEHFPNQQRVDLGNSYVLQLRDTEQPHRLHANPFESDVELAQAKFGREHLSRSSGRARSFFWPSLVRVGPEAARYRERAEGTEGTSGMSSPKRYLCDVEPVNQEWRFQPGDYIADRELPTIDRAVRRYVNYRGDVLRQFADERQFYQRLARVPDQEELSKPAARLTFSRSSFFTFLVAEILTQALSMINNPQMRGQRGEKDTPRRLRRMIFTLPTAIPVREQRLLRSRAVAAVKLVWDLMGWTAAPPPGLALPEVSASWDEASCAQFVYLYSEIAQKFGGNITGFMRLTGRDRPFVGKDGAPGAPQPSIRIASVDIGGGTTDLMITTYFVEDNRAIVPAQTFREGFRVAGEDIVRAVIQQALLPAIEERLKACGLGRARDFLVDRFGADRANMTQLDKHLRRQFVLRVLKPAALGLLSVCESSVSSYANKPGTATLNELVSMTSGQGLPAGDRISNYLDRAAAAWGAAAFNVSSVDVLFDFDCVRNAVETTLGRIFDNIAEAVHHFDCDVILLSGRPSRLAATVNLFVNKLAVPPDRILPLANYPAGNWYPFGGHSRFRIEDPKTATVVGCVLCSLAENQMTNFTMFTNRLAMRSTANFIGSIESDGRMFASNVLFSTGEVAGAPQSGTINWFAPAPLGSRQLAIERWVATPMYRVKLIESASSRAIQRPVRITLERELPEELAEYDSRDFSSIEARKEELRIVDATSAQDANVTRSFGLMLDTLGNDDSYWLDSGILAVV